MTQEKEKTQEKTQESDNWLSENAEIVETIEKDGFCHKKSDYNTSLLFFEKDLTIPFSLGDDIVDETLKKPTYNYDRIKDLLEKYEVRINFTDFYRKTIKREYVISLNYAIRLRIKTSKGYSSSDKIAVLVLNKLFPTKELHEVLDSWKEDSVKEKEYRVEITLDNVKIALKEAKAKMIRAEELINDNLPRIVEIMRKQVDSDKKEHKRAITSNKLRKFLYGALLQFDSLNTDS